MAAGAVIVLAAASIAVAQGPAGGPAGGHWEPEDRGYGLRGTAAPSQWLRYSSRTFQRLMRMLAERSAQLGAPAAWPPAGPPELYEPPPLQPPAPQPERAGPAGPGARPWDPSRGGEAEAGHHRANGARVREWRRARPRSCRNAGLEVGRDGWYVVDAGDTLWSIAEVHYGYGGAYRRIVRANRERIWDPSVIYPCQRIQIPVW